MSKIFLLNQTNSFSIDDQESFCFLFPSEYLFEGFISGFMRDYLNNIADVSIQANVDRLVDEIRYAGRSYQSAYEMRNDILINHPEKGLFVLNTKYKEIPRFDSGEDIRDSIVRSVKQSDLYQVTTYALKHGLSNVYLLYPLYRFEDEEPTGAEFVERFPDGTQIGVHALRIPFVFENDEQKTKDILRNVIESIIEGTDTY